MRAVTLVALISGQKKNGKGAWYKATLKGHNGQGDPVVQEFFLSPEVGEKAVQEGILEDCDVKVQLDFDDYMRPAIVGLVKVPTLKAGA